jgi:hypothetical protein
MKSDQLGMDEHIDPQQTEVVAVDKENSPKFQPPSKQ